MRKPGELETYLGEECQSIQYPLSLNLRLGLSSVRNSPSSCEIALKTSMKRMKKRHSDGRFYWTWAFLCYCGSSLQGNQDQRLLDSLMIIICNKYIDIAYERTKSEGKEQEVTGGLSLNVSIHGIIHPMSITIPPG